MFESPAADGPGMKRTDNHLSLDVLELYLVNRVDQTEEQEVEEHLLVCDRCRLMAIALEQEIELIKSTLGFNGSHEVRTGFKSFCRSGSHPQR